MVIITLVLVVLSTLEGSGMSIWTAVAFVCGALASGLAGYIGMYIAVRANVRTTQAASHSLNQGLRVAFASGTVMGTVVVSLALLGVSVLFVLLTGQLPPQQAASALAGFGFGGTSIAIFARVGGGIYTKAADVGADLVGKTEAGIPEDDPRNPATIADNVGDNVGDVAGMGSDLFESYASSIIAAISLATLGAGLAKDQQLAGQLFPLLVAAAGLIIGMGSTFLVRTEEGATQEMLLGSLRRGIYTASALVGLAIVVIGTMLGLGTGAISATLAGLIGGVLIGYFTEYFTATSYGPTRGLADSASGGAGIVVIRGLALGMLSTLAPVIIVGHRHAGSDGGDRTLRCCAGRRWHAQHPEQSRWRPTPMGRWRTTLAASPKWPSSTTACASALMRLTASATRRRQPARASPSAARP